MLFTYYAAHCAANCACSHMCCKCAPHSAARSAAQARSQEETTELRKQIVQLQIDSEQQEAALKQQHAIELFEAQKALMTSQADGEQKDLELHSSSEQIQKISKLESQIEQQTQLNTKCAAGCCCVALVRLAAADCCFDGSRACVVPAVLYVWCTIRGTLAAGNCLYPDSEHWNVEYSEKNEQSDKRIAKDTMFEMEQIFANQPTASHGGKLGNIPLLTNEATRPVDRAQACYYQRPCLLTAPKDCATWSYSLADVDSSIAAALSTKPDQPVHQRNPLTTDEIAEDEFVEDPAATLAAQRARDTAEARSQEEAREAAAFKKSIADQIAIEELENVRNGAPKSPEQIMSDENNAWFHPDGSLKQDDGETQL